MNKNGKALYKKRLSWLKKNKHIWINYDPDMHSSLAIEKELLVQMKAAKLLPPTANLLDTNFSSMIYRVRMGNRPRGFTYGKQDQD